MFYLYAVCVNENRWKRTPEASFTKYLKANHIDKDKDTEIGHQSMYAQLNRLSIIFNK